MSWRNFCFGVFMDLVIKLFTARRSIGEIPWLIAVIVALANYPRRITCWIFDLKIAFVQVEDSRLLFFKTPPWKVEKDFFSFRFPSRVCFSIFLSRSLISFRWFHAAIINFNSPSRVCVRKHFSTEDTYDERCIEPTFVDVVGRSSAR